ncbi:CRISPR-associated endonuclease Cas2 [Anoxybacillus rupiensis]|uniref:CRISPR-associated endoribonuclease Cas2 n=1 Tax=Anoxybacteroides rupiense TaxID=311460 RepID=A0ABT5W027_9BACL|nr:MULTISPECIES: CRISPR-associated endonuclease Cas2 [Anoxybacillus]MBS2769944.1 CRISPR-associated endonuclease Cas2 [Anoxybacillus rupiensis]MDE8562684.1 CRISPR-associated endonuclease Cas2 [Anoxybacillus rupiensis]
MFVIITYDVGEKRVNKVCKKLREYLTWTQNSVFEGEISKSLLLKCLNEIDQIIDEDEDSIYIYEVANPRNVKKKVFGQEKNFEELFL